MTKAVANREKASEIARYIQSKSKNISDLLPKYLTPERMLRIATLAMSKQPLLLQATPQSFLIAMMDAAKAGLEPNRVDAALIPYGSSVQFQPMWRGLVKQAIRCGAAKKVGSVLVHANDNFKYWRDPEPHIEHYPALEDEGDVVGAYAYAILPDDSLQLEYMNRRQLDHIKSKSQAKSGPWTSDTEEMYRKTTTKRLMKYLNLSDELEYAVAVDNAVEVGTPRSEINFVEIEGEEVPAPKKTRTQQIKESLAPPPEAPGSPRIDDLPEGNDFVSPEIVIEPDKPITEEQIATIEGFCAKLDIPVAACLPDGATDLLDLRQRQAEEVIAKLRKM